MKKRFGILFMALAAAALLSTGWKVVNDDWSFEGPVQFLRTVTMADTLAVTGNETVGGTLAVTGAGTVGGALGVTGAATFSSTVQAPRIPVSRIDLTVRAITSADYGTMLCVSNTGAVAITLPANGATAGSWVDVTVHSLSDNNCAPTISAATADTLIGPNDIDLDSVTWGSGHRIGAQARFWSDGSFWHVQNLGGTTMTYTD